MSADAATSQRIVIDDVWGPIDRRAGSLRDESRRHLDRRRLQAVVLDGLVLLPVTLACVALIGRQDYARLIALSLVLGYFFVCECLSGQTLGKRRYGLRVVRLDGRPLTIASVATRNVLLLVDAVGFYLVGYLVMILSRRRQRLGDLLAGTVVTTAEDHPHVPACERGRTAMLVGYPLAWFATAVLAVVLLFGGADARRGYVAQALGVCRAAVAGLPYTGGAGGVRQAGLVAGSIERALATIQPPAGMEASHARLLAAERQISADLLQASREIESSANPGLTAQRALVRLEAHREAAARALQGTGLSACL